MAHEPDDDRGNVEPGGDVGAGEALLDALLSGDRSRARAILQEELEQAGSYAAVVDDLVRPVMVEIGRGWADHELSVSDEHLATAMVQVLLADAFGNAEPRPGSDRRVLLACVEGNQHSLGLRGLADAFELVGWETRFLGADVPTDDLVEDVAAWTPDLLCLSLSMEAHVDAAGTVVEQVRKTMGDRAPRILLGGPLDASEGTADRVGADAWMSTVSDALEATA